MKWSYENPPYNVQSEPLTYMAGKWLKGQIDKSRSRTVQQELKDYEGHLATRGLAESLIGPRQHMPGMGQAPFQRRHGTTMQQVYHKFGKLKKVFGRRWKKQPYRKWKKYKSYRRYTRSRRYPKYAYYYKKRKYNKYNRRYRRNYY